MGSKSPSQTYQSSSYAPTGQAASAISGALSAAQNAAATPYKQYTGELTAGVNSQEQGAINSINGVGSATNGYLGSASGLAGASTAAVNPSALGAAQIQQYESPYQSDVINATMAQIQNQNQQQAQSLKGNAISAGAYGGDRAGIAQAALANQQDLASNQTLANLNNQNYAQALGEANTQQQLGLSADQANRAALQQGASIYSGLGSLANSTGLATANAALQGGILQQQTQQAADTAQYGQFENAAAYPFQTAQFLAGTTGALAPLLGGTTYGTQTQAAPNSANSILGAGLGLLSLFNRGGAVSHLATGGVPNTPYADAGSGYVPAMGLAAAHMQQPQMNFGSSGQGQQGQQQSGVNNLMSGAKMLAGSFGPNSSGDYSNAGAAAYGLANGLDMSDIGFKRGGNVIGLAAARRARQHFDDGGTVSPDDLTFNPDALGAAPTMQPGIGALPAPTTMQPPPAAGLATAPAPTAPSNDNATKLAPIPVGPTPNPTPVLAYQGGNDDAAAPAQNNGLGAIATATRNDPAPGFGNIIAAESGGRQFDKNGAPLTSSAGAVGIAQVMPSTGPEAASLAGVPWDEDRFRNDPSYNYQLGKAYYGQQLKAFGGDPAKAAAAYNAGPARVQDAMAQAAKSGGSYLDYLPAETQAYVAKTAGGPSSNGALAYADGGNGAGFGSGPRSLHPMLPVSSAGTSAALATGATPRAGLLGNLGYNLGLSDNQRMALLSAGLGIMASPSRNLGMAIGQGGLQGLQQYQALRQLDTKNALAAASLANTQSEIGTRQGQLALGNRRVDIASQQFQRQLEQTAAQIKNETARTKSEVGLQGAQTYGMTHQMTPQGMLVTDPSNPSKPPSIVPYSTLQQGAPQGSANAPAAGGSAPGATGAQPAPQHPVVEPNGYAHPPAQVPINPMLFSKEGQAQSADLSKSTMDGARTGYEASQGMKVSLDQMQHDLGRLPSTGFLAAGPGQQQRTEVANGLNSLLRGFGVSDANLPNAEAIGATEELKKLSTRMGFDLSRSIGGKEPGFIVQQAVGAVPSSDNSPLGAQRLIGGLRAVAQRQEDRYRYLTEWAQKAGGDLTGADEAFNRDNPPSKYVGQAVLSTVPPTAVSFLKQHPEARSQFDAKYGSGSSQYVLGSQ